MGTDFTTFAVPVPFGCIVCPFTFSGLLPGVGRKNDQPCNVTLHGYWTQTTSPLNIIEVKSLLEALAVEITV